MAHTSHVWAWTCKPRGLAWRATHPSRTPRKLWGRAGGFLLLSTAQSDPVQENAFRRTWKPKKLLAPMETPTGSDCQGSGHIPVGRRGFIACPPISQVHRLLILLPFPIWKTSAVKRLWSEDLKSPLWVYTADLLRLGAGLPTRPLPGFSDVKVLSRAF